MLSSSFSSSSQILTMSGDPLVLGHVVGDVLDPFVKSVSLKIFYNNRQVLNGAQLKPSAVVHRPRVDVGGDEFRVFYTLIMVDPDAPNPSNPTSREHLLWMVTDIPGTTDSTFGYESPRPVSGIHRMVFVLFQQLSRESVFAPDMRQNFNTRNFAREHYLGAPVAAVYFNCQRESGSGGRRFT